MRMTAKEIKKSDEAFYRNFLVLYCGLSEEEVAALSYDECEGSYCAWIAVK